MNQFVSIALLLSLMFIGKVNAQRITLNGNIFSFKGEKVLLMKKAQKNVSFDGSLENATIRVMGESTNLTITTGLSGSFSIPFEKPGRYKIEITKNNYSTIDFRIEYVDPGKKSRFESFFLILKQDDNSNVHMGTIEINEGNLVFIPDDAEFHSSKNDLLQSNAHLIEKAVLINKSGGGQYMVDKKIEAKKITNINERKSDTNKLALLKSNEKQLMFLLENDNETNLDSLRNRLSNAKKLLGQLSPESSEYKLLLKQIELAEQSIKDKEALIAVQKNEISLANRIIIFISLFAVFAVALAGFLFYFFKQKKRYSVLLKEKNKNILKINSKMLSSIRYASLIQSSFLQDKNRLKKLFSDSFVFNLPKDILSGDFYWFAHKNNHKIVVVADCTGHGVPGAMLTVLGHNILEDIINVQGEVIPSKILMTLNKAIQQTFANNQHYLEYGIDLAVISIKDNSKELLLSGVNNGLYRIRNGNSQYFPVSPKTLGSDITENDLADQKIHIETGDKLFLFTDGYVDQFSAEQNKIVKFNINRFENLILSLSKSNSFVDSESALEKTFVEWKGERDQIDDVCIVGLKI